MSIAYCLVILAYPTRLLPSHPFQVKETNLKIGYTQVKYTGIRSSNEFKMLTHRITVSVMGAMMKWPRSETINCCLTMENLHLRVASSTGNAIFKNITLEHNLIGFRYRWIILATVCVHVRLSSQCGGGGGDNSNLEEDARRQREALGKNGISHQ